MRILQIARQFAPSTGGIEQVTLGLSRALLTAGQQCDVLTLNRIFADGRVLPATEQIEELQVYRLPYIGSRRYPFAPGILGYAGAYDLLHVHAIDFFIDALSMSSTLHGKPIIVSTHGGIFHTRWLAPLKRMWFATLTRLSLRNAAAVICDSEQDARLFRPIVPAHKLHSIPNGVDVAPFLALRKQVQPGLLVGIGRLVANKGIDRLIRLLARLAPRHPELRLVWIGGGTDEALADLQRQAQAAGIAQHVIFTGRIADEEMHDWLSKAHAYISPSHYEAFGVATVEAMASATLSLATPTGIHSEVIKHGENGYLLDPRNDEAAARIIEGALNLTPDHIAVLGERARKVAAEYAWEKIVQRYLSVYRACINGGAS